MNFRKSRARSRKNSMSVMVCAEKWRNYAKRLSKKGADFGDSDEDSPGYDEIKDWVQHFFETKNDSIDKVDQDVEVHLTRKQTIILSTLVPDELLLMKKFDDQTPKRFVGVLLMADVSGFTALSERYNNTGKGGTYRLTVTLNTYLGSLIELIYSHGGDILKFAGDAFLALWKTDKRSFLYHTIHNVIACALVIQHSYSSYETDVKVNLRVKLAISAGNLIFAPIGSGIDMNYVMLGLPVLEAKTAESVCSSGEVILTPSAWAHCFSRNYDHVVHSNGHVTIKSILYDPHDNDVTKPFLGFGALLKQVKRPLNVAEGLPDCLWESNKNLNAADAMRKSEALNLRKTILVADENNIGSEIRKFMIRPVLTQIDAHQPLEYLTEMRQVSILFVTLKPREGPFLQLVTIVNNAYQITCEIVYKSMGCVNKIILFDKDIMILVVFGLRGFKHESEAQVALKCAYSIKKSVLALDGVQEVSIGVTTGQVYCGVVGHPLRREFTVIGAIVNKAARLMCKFRNKVTCDESTFIKSKMSSNGFTLQPATELKGIGKVGKIYEYTEEIRVKELYDIPMTQPLLDRIDEMDYYETWLEDRNASFRDFDALALVGESRIGKSRLLEWMARYARNKEICVCYLSLSSIHSATPNLAISQIINQILGITEPIVGFIKEERIVQLMKVYSEDLCYLNNIIKVRFAYHEAMYTQDDNIRKEKAKLVFSKLIAAIIETHVIFLDDLQNVDMSSWEFILLMLSSKKIFIVVAISRGKFSSVRDWLYSVFINSNIRKMALGPLEPEWIPALACQILDVHTVPKVLCDALTAKCNGFPGLVESFITHLFSTGAIELKKVGTGDIDDLKSKNLVFPDSNLLHPQALNAEEQQRLDDFIAQDDTGTKTICVVTNVEELNTNINIQNLDALVMIQIDSLTPYQQLLLKIASVIGNVLSRSLLESIMFENNWLTTARAVKRLFAMRILTCANVVNLRSSSKTSQHSYKTYRHQRSEMSLLCECSFDYDPEASENLPKYAFCKVMKFKNSNSRKTCYELLPLNQKKEFHSRIVYYLENNKQKCPACGDAIIVVQSAVSVQSFQSEPVLLAPSIESKKHTFHNENSKNFTNESAESQTLTRALSENLVNNNNDVNDANQNRLSRYESSDSALKNIHHTSILRNKTSSEHDSMMIYRPVKKVTMTDLLKPSSTSFVTTKIFDKLRDVTEAENSDDWRKLGVVDSLENIEAQVGDKKSFCVKIEQDVSQTNFNKCTCSDLQVATYEQLIHHALQAELKEKAVEFIITFCYLNLLGNNIEKIFGKLDEAEQLCSENLDLFGAFNAERYMGKILSLRAAACLMIERLAAAKIELDRAFKIYRIKLDKISVLSALKNIVHRISMKRHKYRTLKLLMKIDSVYCLNVATLLYSSLGEEKIAKITAFKALQLAQSVECPFVDMCDVYSNALQVEIIRGAYDSTAEIEKMACKDLHRRPRRIQVDELYAAGKYLMGCFRARIARGQLTSAIRSGFRALTISRFLQAETITVDIIPDLFYILLSRRRIEEAIDVLELMLKMSHGPVPHENETWYYALCMDMILDAGFQLESPHDISVFAEFSLSRGKIGGPGRRRLVINLWTYWLRADSATKAKQFETEALSWISNEEDDGSMTTLLSILRLTEAMLESLAKKVDDLRKVVDLMELRSVADRELLRIEADTRIIRALTPRWNLLKANSLKLSGRHTAAANLYNLSMEEARRINNRLEESLARAAMSNSVFWEHSARSGTFVHWRPGAEHARTAWHQIMYKIVI